MPRSSSRSASAQAASSTSSSGRPMTCGSTCSTSCRTSRRRTTTATTWCGRQLHRSRCGPGAGSGLRRAEQHARRRPTSPRSRAHESSTASTTRSRGRTQKASSNYGSLAADYKVSEACRPVRPGRHVRRVTARRRRRTCPRRMPRTGLGAELSAATDSAARPTSTSVQPTPRHPFPGGSPGRLRLDLRRAAHGRRGRGGPGRRSMPTSRSTAARGPACKVGVRYNEHSRESLNDATRARELRPAVAGGPNGQRSGELSRRLSRLPVRLQHFWAGRSRRTSGTGRRRSLRPTTLRGPA